MSINPIDNLVNEILNKLPQGSDVLADDVNQNLKAAITAAMKKMNLVTRDEFDVQRAVLEKTREKLSELEQVVKELEAKNWFDLSYFPIIEPLLPKESLQDS